MSRGRTGVATRPRSLTRSRAAGQTRTSPTTPPQRLLRSGGACRRIAAMREKHLTQGALAELSSVGHNTIGRVSCGDVLPDLATSRPSRSGTRHRDLPHRPVPAAFPINVSQDAQPVDARSWRTRLAGRSSEVAELAQSGMDTLLEGESRLGAGFLRKLSLWPHKLSLRPRAKALAEMCFRYSVRPTPCASAWSITM